MDLVGLVERLVVDEDLLVLDLDLFALERDDPFDEVLGQVLRVLEDDDILPRSIGFRGRMTPSRGSTGRV